MNRYQHSRRLVAGGALLLAALSASAAGLGVELDPTSVHRLTVGSPAGYAVMSRFDSQRTGRSSHRLPKQPLRIARARAPGPLMHGVAADETGRIVAVTESGRLVQFSPEGQLEWTQRLGAPPVTAPILISGGRRAVITAERDLVRVTPRGRVDLRLRLPYSFAARIAPPLPTFDGGIVLGHAGRVVWYDLAGKIRAEALVPGTVSALLQSAETYWVVTEDGMAYGWQPGSKPTKLGEFGGRTGDAVALGGQRQLVAVVDGRELIALDLRSGGAHTLIAKSPIHLTADLIVFDGLYVVGTANGLALGVGLRGQEAFRLALWPQGPASPSGANNAALLGDPGGALAFASPSGAVAVAEPSGETHFAPEGACVDPLAIVPVGRKRFAVACRSGILSYFGAQPANVQG